MIWHQTSLCATPPVKFSLGTRPYIASIVSMAQRELKAMPSNTARTMCSREWLRPMLYNPARANSSSIGHLSPNIQGVNIRPPAPGPAFSASWSRIS